MLVEAELTDYDMFNPAKNFNDVAYHIGDVFEIFVRPEGQDAYYEIHVTPDNQVLQLRLADATEVKKPKPGDTQDEKLAPYKVWDPRITSSVKLDVPGNKWFVNATIPFKLVVESGPMKPGDRWLCSFSRYDYTRSPASCIHSSTSPHKVLSFHRQEEWTPIVFEL